MILPDNPTPEQLQRIVLTLIRFVLEPSADDVGDIEPIAGGWRTTYSADGIRYAIEYDGSEFSKIPIVDTDKG